MSLDLHQSAARTSSRIKAACGKSISTAPFDRDLELAVIDDDGPHALVFPCRRILRGWVKSETEERVDVHPMHWRDWQRTP
jgi:isoaspartyl peptidase/L-asparaginase-like protein (Ntn-hydrolase superfamily)